MGRLRHICFCVEKERKDVDAMTEKLKPCPFCGGKEVKLFKEGSIWVVECLQCLAKVGATAKADVLDFWNSRPIEDWKDDENARLEKNLKDYNRVMLENARLREALEEISRGFASDSRNYTREQIIRIAKEVLK